MSLKQVIKEEIKRMLLEELSVGDLRQSQENLQEDDNFSSQDELALVLAVILHHSDEDMSYIKDYQSDYLYPSDVGYIVEVARSYTNSDYLMNNYNYFLHLMRNGWEMSKLGNDLMQYKGEFEIESSPKKSLFVDDDGYRKYADIQTQIAKERL